MTLKMKDGEKPTAGTLSGYCSALFNLFHEFSVEIPDKLIRKLKIHFRSLKSKRAKNVGDGIGRLKIGKAWRAHRLHDHNRG